MTGLRGQVAGLNLFYISVSVETEKDGWTGGKQFPSFWTVGGYPIDAIHNARRIIGFAQGDLIDTGARVTRFTVSATLATDSDTAPLTVSWDSQDNHGFEHGGVYTVSGGNSAWWDGIVSHGDGLWRARMRYADGSEHGYRMHGSGLEALADIAARFAAADVEATDTLSRYAH
jgi:hypothetical protein